MADDLSVHYWDACIFYEYIRKDQADAGRRAAIDNIISDNKQRNNRICTSVITHTEVLPKKIAAEDEKRYWSIFFSLFFFDIEVDKNTISLAREIKNFYFEQKTDTSDYKCLGTMDCIHLATAIVHNVTFFETRDKRPRGGNIPIIGLGKRTISGKICDKYDLDIVDPEIRDLFTEISQRGGADAG